MTKRISMMVAMGVALAALPVTASASLAGLAIGGRVGGYGFREQASGSGDRSRWDACRMNGIGVFAQKELPGPFFLEVGLDAYFSEDFPLGSSDAHSDYETPLDRLSALTTVAAGVRWFPRAIVSPYVQIGAGAEVTRVRAPELSLEDSYVLPMGFFGIGAELRAGSRLRLGANLRVNLMGYFDDDALMTRFDPQAEIAAQGQFYAKYEL
jgi:hypothetical protein